MSARDRPKSGTAPRRLAILLVLAAAVLGGCGNTLQDRPIAHNTLESLLVAPYPVYWLGGSFHGLAITEAAHDPGGAFTVGYGDCVVGGQSTCVPALLVVSSPDNSFVPGGSSPQHAESIRDVTAVIARKGQAIEIPTAGVVVGIYAINSRLAASAAATIVPINETGVPGAPLPPRRRDTGFAATPLPSQMPSPLHALR